MSCLKFAWSELLVTLPKFAVWPAALPALTWRFVCVEVPVPVIEGRKASRAATTGALLTSTEPRADASRGDFANPIATACCKSMICGTPGAEISVVAPGAGEPYAGYGRDVGKFAGAKVGGADGMMLGAVGCPSRKLAVGAGRGVGAATGCALVREDAVRTTTAEIARPAAMMRKWLIAGCYPLARPSARWAPRPELLEAP